MAEPVAPSEIGSWRGENVRLGRVIDALSELRRGGQRTATRACVTNLVVVAGVEDDVERACDAVHHLGRRHPGRNIVLLPRPGAGPAGLDASVLLHGSVAEGHPVWSEDVRLDVRGAPAGHLDSFVEPLTLPDLPVAVWYVRSVPHPGDPLLRAAGTVLVDAGSLGTGDDVRTGVADLNRLTRRHVVVDLCWERLRPWRQLLAAQFDLPRLRPYASQVREIAVEGPFGARLLLAGWLTARLALPASVVTFTDGASPAVRLVAGDGDQAAVVSVAELAGAAGASVRSWATVAGRAGREDRRSQPDDPLAWALGEALIRLRRDRVYGQALQAALLFGA